MTRQQPEAALQKAAAVLLRAQFPKLLWWHTPQTNTGPVQWRKKLADMGLRPGAPDLAMLFENGRSGFIELKSKSGRLSAEQAAFRDAAVARGAYWACCRDLESVKAAVRAWDADSKAELAFRGRAA